MTFNPFFIVWLVFGIFMCIYGNVTWDILVLVILSHIKFEIKLR